MDNSWDNSNSFKPNRSWKYKGTLVTLSILAFCTLSLITIWILWSSRNEANIVEEARERAKPDWVAAAVIVEKMRTEIGSKALYQANPKLSVRFKSEKEFLDFVARWRPYLESLPKNVPRSGENIFGHRHGLGWGPTILSYKMPQGWWVIFQWNGPYDFPSRQLTNIECFR